MHTLKRIWPQLFPPANSATITEANAPSQTGKVIIITGSTSGVGYELARILYRAGATVYMAARNQDKAEAAIRKIEESAESTTPGTLKFLSLDLNDLRTVKPFVDAFLAAETRLDLLYNNAGVANVPPSKRTVQGLESHLGVNCVGPYLLTQLLAPRLVATAKDPARHPTACVLSGRAACLSTC
ncbi:hypothetical protein VTN77DRAFT_8421 [Rasamsonia byssochlamydoides]|uniref:uncharacterized protein n=1 Tax=Rasamsonia byssochlamydoides TaxID=89139 RepID=UPI003743E513